MGRKARGRSSARDGNGAGLIQQTHRTAFFDAYYQRVVDQSYELLKDPEWRDFAERTTEEFARLLLKTIQKRRAR